MITDLKHESPLGKSDHCLLKFNFVCHTEHPTKTHRIFYHDQGDYESMKADIYKEIEIKMNPSIKDPNKLWELLIKGSN